MGFRVAFAVFVLAVSGSAAELSLQPGPEIPGQAPSLQVRLTSSAVSPSAALTGVQFDLAYDTTEFEISVVGGPVADGAGKAVKTAANANGQRVLVIGFNQNTLSDGVVAILRISRKSTVARDHGVRLTAPAGTDGSGNPIAVTLRNFERNVP